MFKSSNKSFFYNTFYNFCSYINVIGCNDNKKLNLNAYCFQKYMHMEQIQMKLNVCLFLMKAKEFLEKYNEIWEKVSNVIKK